MKNGQSLSKVMYKNVLLNYILRGMGIFLGLFSTRLSLKYLGISLFGVWATIASIASWVNYGDFGIGNGLRNYLADAFAKNDVDKQKSLIFTGTKILLILTVFLFLCLIIISEIIFYFKIMDSSYRIPLYITNFFFSLDLFLSIGRSIAYAQQKSWLTSFAQMFTVLFRITGVFILILLQSNTGNLILFSVVSGLGGLFGNILLLLVLYVSFDKSFFKNIRQFYDKNIKKNIVGLGLKFFVLQVSCLVLYSSDNIIISRLISSAAVTKYDLITKIYNMCNNLFSIFLISLWSAVTYAISKSDFKWIKKEIKRLICFWGLYSLGVIIVSLFINVFVKIWLETTEIYYEFSLVMLFAFYEIINGFGSIFVNITNGMGRLKIQLPLVVIGAISNIPLSIFFAHYLGWGIFGIKLATLLCCMGNWICVPVDIVYFINKKIKKVN